MTPDMHCFPMTLKIGKLKIGLGFPFFALATYFLSGDMCKNYLCAVIFSSLHELGHLIPMFIYGCEVKEISLDGLGIRIDKKMSSMSYENECITALCGPFVNLVFALVFAVLKTRSDVFVLPFNINIGLFFINMLPVRTLDGGRFVRCFLLKYFDEEKVYRISSIFEIVVALLLIAVLIVTLVSDEVNTSFVFFALGLVGIIVFNLLKS